MKATTGGIMKKNTSLDEAIKEFINKNIECRKSLQHKMK